MKKIILAAIGATLSLPLLASTSTSSTTTTTSPAKVKEVTTTTTTREETPVTEQLTTEKSTSSAIPQSMEEAPQPDTELSSPSLAPSTDAAPLEQREEAGPSFQSAPWEKQKMEQDLEEDEEFVPGSQINDVDEEEE